MPKSVQFCKKMSKNRAFYLQIRFFKTAKVYNGFTQ